MKLSKARLKGLRILLDEGGSRGVKAGWFAKKMWPDSPSWTKHSNCGPNGSTTGTGIRMYAGTFLMKLTKDGLAHYLGWEYGYRISDEGRKVLAENTEKEE